MQIYRAEKDESIYDIARKYDVSPIKIAEDNDLEIRGHLPKNKEVLVRVPSRTYNVRSADTLEGIARRFKTDKETLLRLNPELCGRERIYSGQLLTIKDTTPSYGMISTNGYLYPGTVRDRLISIIPYLSYVTVCSAVYKGSHVHNICPSDDTVSFVKSRGRAPMLRVYMTELPKEDKDFAGSVAILAKSLGFLGITLSSLNSLSDNDDRLSSLTLAVRRALIENDLLLFVEGEADKSTAYMDYADAGILTYDKLHIGNAPSFADGEAAVLSEFANSSESCRAFVEISGFAYSDGRYVEKREALRTIDRKRAEITHDSERGLQDAVYGRHKRREVRYESLENTKAKLEIVSELGFMGVSFDIGRIYTGDLMSMASMFDIITSPVMMPRVSANQEM